MKSRTAIAKVLQWSKDLRFFAHFLSLWISICCGISWLDDKAKTKPPGDCTCCCGHCKAINVIINRNDHAFIFTRWILGCSRLCVNLKLKDTFQWFIFMCGWCNLQYVKFLVQVIKYGILEYHIYNKPFYKRKGVSRKRASLSVFSKRKN